MPLRELGLADLTIEDERSFRHVGLYTDLKAALVRHQARFAVATPSSPLAHPQATLLLNLVYWRPDAVAEILTDDVVTADQLMHAAWHHLAARHLGEAARTVAGLLVAESIASAFDVYLVGRLLGHAPQAAFLETQVPAMTEAAIASGLDEEGVEALLARTAEEPEGCFELLRRLLFDVGMGLVAAQDASAAAAVLEQWAGAEMYPLLHHFELPTWVLFARAYADPHADDAPARALDASMRAAPVALDWLTDRWIR